MNLATHVWTIHEDGRWEDPKGEIRGVEWNPL